VSIIALRRNNQEIEQPDESTTLLPQDTLILRGKPRKVEHTERYLHKGQN
jgi:CPA2 family monovalent cation:H+ antiporter-2